MEKRSFSDGSRSGGSKLIGGSRSFGRSGPTEESSSTESSGFTGKSGPIEVDFLLKNAGSLVTIKDEDDDDAKGLGLITDGSVAAHEGVIVAVGTTAEIEKAFKDGVFVLRNDATVFDASGCLVTPGLVDAHTHLIFAGWRAEEFALRLKGASYLDILARGGGILSTVRATRRASEDELFLLGMDRLDQMLLCGTTTVEVKSGYGLSTEDEIKSLRVAARLGREHPADVIPTFLGAHAIPEEYAGNVEGYIEVLVSEMIPRVAEERLAKFVDVFCEEGVFSVDQSRRILSSAKDYGFGLKIHADELSPLGGAVLAAELDAVSADHLVMVDERGIRYMAEKKVSAVLLPGTSFFLAMDRYAPARRIIEEGVPLALATDFNPGTCTIQSLPLVMGIACLRMGLSPEEVIKACTLGAARALGMEEEIGSLEAKKAADMVVFDVPSFHHLPYRFGANLVKGVIKRGKIVVKDGCLTYARSQPGTRSDM
ncbi:MAG TPA: imidazolonepropionase [Clostridia bacterium]|nr:imidazolonepropionase [Clostridia bacterium]